MSTTSRCRRLTLLCAIACMLLTPAAGAAAAADPLAQERYYESFRPLEVSAEEQYYSSYGEPEPLTRGPSNDMPWLAIALSIGGALAIGGASAAQLQRVRVRRRRGAHTAAPAHPRQGATP